VSERKDERASVERATAEKRDAAAAARQRARERAADEALPRKSGRSKPAS
jgi:hypothetical protein